MNAGAFPTIATPSTALVLNLKDKGSLVFPEKLSQLLERVLKMTIHFVLIINNVVFIKR